MESISFQDMIIPLPHPEAPAIRLVFFGEGGGVCQGKQIFLFRGLEQPELPANENRRYSQ
jgi:hypothetical protein